VRLRDISYEERALQATLQADKNVQMPPGWSQTITTALTSCAPTSAALPTVPSLRHCRPSCRRSTSRHATVLRPYVQSEVSDGRWTIVPGVRIDRFAIKVLSQDGYYPTVSATPGSSLSGSATSPKLGVLWRANPTWAVFANAAGGFRAPEGQQVNSTLEVSTARLLPNPDLKPEESRNFELGLRGQVGGLSMDMAVFESRYEQLIVEKKNLGTADGGTATTSNPTLFQTVNIERATITGFEFKGQMAWGAALGGQWSSAFSYGQIRGTDDTTGLKLNYIDPAEAHLDCATQLVTGTTGRRVLARRQRGLGLGQPQCGQPTQRGHAVHRPDCHHAGSQWPVAHSQAPAPQPGGNQPEQPEVLELVRCARPAHGTRCGRRLHPAGAALQGLAGGRLLGHVSAPDAEATLSMQTDNGGP
jgi:hemoglobin/transferrin/lactoferrin receptor protein